MTFCCKERQLVSGGNTTVDNKFIINYLPDAPDIRSAVYLLGLALADSEGNDNSIETMAQKLSVSTDDIMSCFEYWEELGLVSITFDNPPRIIYLALKDSATALKKIKPNKYAKFNKDIQAVIAGRMITPNETNAYMMFLEDTTFEPSALVAVASYCVALKGNDISYNYILTVARNLLTKGITTLATVEDSLNSQQKYDDDLKIIFKLLKLNRNYDYEDRELYEKWTAQMGFTADVVVAVAKSVKTGGMKKLDSLLCEYYKHNALSTAEIKGYEDSKQELFDIAKEVTKNIGVYYQSLDMVVEEYITKWLSKGFDKETILAVAKYCFRCGVRTLNGLNSVIEKLYKQGISSVEALDCYLQTISQKDEEIKKVLDSAGLERNVTQNDRNLFNTWINDWKMPQDVILYVATKSAGTNAPMAYINRVLSLYKQNGITTLDQAKAQENSTATTASNGKNASATTNNIERHEYTNEQLNALFTVLDDSETK